VTNDKKRRSDAATLKLRQASPRHVHKSRTMSEAWADAKADPANPKRAGIPLWTNLPNEQFLQYKNPRSLQG